MFAFTSPSDYRAAAGRAALVALLIVFLLLTSSGCVRSREELSGAFAAGFEEYTRFVGPIVFAGDYACYVAGEDPDRGGIAKWYAAEASGPDLDHVRGSFTFPDQAKMPQDNFPVRGVAVALNFIHHHSVVQPLETGGLLERVSEPGENPVWRLTFPVGEGSDPAEPVRETEGKELTLVVEYRHKPGLAPDKRLLTFELWGTDPGTGEPKAERHNVVMIANPDQKPEARPFLVTSHVVEELPPDQEE